MTIDLFPLLPYFFIGWGLFLVSAALYCWRQDMRHLRCRAREIAEEPVLDDTVREAVRLRVVESRPNVYVLADRRRGDVA